MVSVAEASLLYQLFNQLFDQLFGQWLHTFMWIIHDCSSLIWFWFLDDKQEVFFESKLVHSSQILKLDGRI